ncbi:MAG: hypothetical protein KBS95_07000 [Alistipes sp.]|nr:hypothetical protein [Candidatus Alistipes equi]
MRRIFIIVFLLLCSFSLRAGNIVQKRDTVAMYLPNTRIVNRNMKTSCFGHKGEFFLGITASHGNLSTEDAELLVFLDNINLSGKITTIKPQIGYLYSRNHLVGFRFGYSFIDASLGNLDLDLGEANDVSLNLSGIKFRNKSFSYALYHRSYLPLDRKGRIAVFAEFDLKYQYGKTQFMQEATESKSGSFTISKNDKVKLTFMPGMAVHILPNVTAQLAIGLGGAQYAHVDQYDENGLKTGSRDFYKFSFKLLLSELHFGLTFHMGGKKHRETSYGMK